VFLVAELKAVSATRGVQRRRAADEDGGIADVVSFAEVGEERMSENGGSGRSELGGTDRLSRGSTPAESQ
jgi:hypothetical protein